MAKGRMMVKEFSYDERIWAISERSALLFAACIPHIETDGTLPRAASMIRLMCFPSAKVTTQDTESAILEWLATNPPLCEERERRLFFCDFEASNEGLSFARMRKVRTQKDIGPVTHSDKSDARLQLCAEEKRSEVKKEITNTFASGVGMLYSVGFLAFWKAYPRQIRQKAASEAWGALGLNDPGQDPALLDAVMNGLEAHKRHWVSKGTELEFIPSPANWLSEHRWTDTLDQAPSAIPTRKRVSCPMCGSQNWPEEMKTGSNGKVCSECLEAENG